MTDQEIINALTAEGNEYFKALTIAGVNDNARMGRPFIIVSDDALPEIPVAMDISCSIMTVAGAMGTVGAGAAERIDKATEMGVENRLCASVKMGAYFLKAGILPVPDMVITTNSPCDAVDMLGQMMDNYPPWAKVPKFRLDAPHGQTDEDFAYFGAQLREMVQAIEKATGKKLTRERFVEVAEESNRQASLIMDFQELTRAVPCPVDPDMARVGWELARWVAATDPSVFPKATGWLERLVDVTERKVKAKTGMDGVQEKIRFLWYDVSPAWGSKLFPRLRSELGAVCMKTYYSFHNYIPIDTTSMDSMLTSVAKKYLMGTPMTRQAMHTADVFCDDIVRICKDDKCDAMIMPCHIGHRDTNAYQKLARDTCRANGIPFFFLGCDVWDERYMSADVVFDRLKTFFQSTGLA
ncbi:MAG: 2-hydroxyacyl-CoA dehydratase family protein [Deltaproteobacteria bacterium]